MQRLEPIDRSQAPSQTAVMLDKIERQMGRVPNILATMAQSESVLQGYSGFSASLAGSSLSAKLREQIALAVAEANRCGYCLAAHVAIGRSVGLSDEDICDSRRGAAPDRMTDAALKFSTTLVHRKGVVDDEDVADLRSAGFDDRAIVEIVAAVGLSIFTNYFNHVAGTDIDFPEAPEVVECVKSDS